MRIIIFPVFLLQYLTHQVHVAWASKSPMPPPPTQALHYDSIYTLCLVLNKRQEPWRMDTAGDALQ